jgi:hypothetical protein
LEVTVKTIGSLRDVARVDPSEVQPGWIIAEGIVYDVDRTYANTTGVQLHVPLGVVYVLPGDTIQIYGKLAHEATVSFVEHMEKRLLVGAG